MKHITKQEKPAFLVRSNRILKSESGQSLAEFILTFGIMCMIVFVFVKLAFNFTKGYLIHYANFMASRSYLVQDNNSGVATSTDSNAQTIALNNVYKKIYSGVNISQVKVQSPDRADNKVYIGIVTTIEEDFSLTSSVGGGEKIKLISESFLGREPPISECAKGVCDAISAITGEGCGVGNSAGFVTLWDNGC